MDDRDKQLWTWLNKLPIEFDNAVIEVNIKPLNDCASQIVEERQASIGHNKLSWTAIWTADSRSAPAFESIALVPNFDSYKCSIFVVYKGGSHSSFEVFLNEFYRDTPSAKL